MISPDNSIKVLEYNCRMGDPETQPILFRLQSDIVTLCFAALEGRLDQTQVQWDSRAAVAVVMAAGGYPGTYQKGDVIEGLDVAVNSDTKIFHAGTTEKDGQVVTNGGRVLAVTALGNDIQTAKERAYAIVQEIRWNNCYYRTDIGSKESKATNKPARRLPPIWITASVAGIILLSIFIPYHKKLNTFSAPVLKAIQQITKTR